MAAAGSQGLGKVTVCVLACLHLELLGPSSRAQLGMLSVAALDASGIKLPGQILTESSVCTVSSVWRAADQGMCVGLWQMEPQFEQVGKAFIAHYYQAFDTNRASLADLYQNESMCASCPFEANPLCIAPPCQECRMRFDAIGQ